MNISEKDLLNTLTFVQKKLLNYADIEINEHKILQDDISKFSSYVYEYICDDFAKIKNDIRNQYSQNNINHYVDLLYHTKKYIELRYSSDTELDPNKMMNDLVELLQKFFENDVLNINEDFYYIIFENYANIQNWMKDYCKNYAIVISHYILINQ